MPDEECGRRDGARSSTEWKQRLEGESEGFVGSVSLTATGRGCVGRPAGSLPTILRYYRVSH